MAEKLPAYATPDQIPAVVNNLTSDSTTAALSAAQGKALNSKLSTLGGRYAGTNLNATISVANDTAVAISTITLPPGSYLVIGCADWQANSTGYRQIAFADSINPTRNQAVTTVGIASKEAYQQICAFMSPSSETTITLYARQTSGSALSCYPYMYAQKMGG